MRFLDSLRVISLLTAVLALGAPALAEPKPCGTPTCGTPVKTGNKTCTTCTVQLCEDGKITNQVQKTTTCVIEEATAPAGIPSLEAQPRAQSVDRPRPAASPSSPRLRPGRDATR